MFVQIQQCLARVRWVFTAAKPSVAHCTADIQALSGSIQCDGTRDVTESRAVMPMYALGSEEVLTK